MGPMTGNFQAQVLWNACKKGHHLTLCLTGARHGAHTLRSCQNHTHFEPQITLSEIFCYSVIKLHQLHSCSILSETFHDAPLLRDALLLHDAPQLQARDSCSVGQRKPLKQPSQL